MPSRLKQRISNRYGTSSSAGDITVEWGDGIVGTVNILHAVHASKDSVFQVVSVSKVFHE